MRKCGAPPQDEAITAENFTHLNNNALELKITYLSANINAATCEQVMLIAEFDTRQAWGHEGVRSCAHWLNWRCGISFGAAREKIRVGHALVDLPQTRAAFASGQLSYSKVRAITRVGTLANEQYLLSYARYGTASQLEKTCRLYRQQYPSNNQEAERLAACHAHDHRRLTTHWDADGCLVIKAKLTAEQGALVLKAISAGVETGEQNGSQEQNVPAGTPDLVKPALDIDAAQRKRANRRADALVLMAETLLHHQTHGSNTADRHQVVVHVDHDTLAQSTGFVTGLEPGLKPDCYIENEVAIPVETARRLSCCSKIIAAVVDGGEVLNIGRSSRAVPSSIQRALHIRDGVCQFPGCSCDRHLDAHHIIHWANDGETSLDNLIQVCHYHHKLVHEGGYSVTREDGALKFTSPDGTEIKQVRKATTSDGPIKSNQSYPWQWNGDSMDYSVAMAGLSSADGREVVF